MNLGQRLNKLLRVYTQRSCLPAELEADDLFPVVPDLPLPEGISEKELHSFLRSVCSLGEPTPKVVEKYGEEHFRRVVYTYGLVRGLKGKCLELGSSPYFMTILLKQFTDLDLVLANYFGSQHKQEKDFVEISFKDLNTQNKRSIKSEFYHFNIEGSQFPFDDAEFDVVLFCEIIEHLLMDPVSVLLEIKRVLKPDGVLILTTPNVNKLDNILKITSGSNIYGYYSGHGPYGRHNREYTTNELKTLLDYWVVLLQ